MSDELPMRFELPPELVDDGSDRSAELVALTESVNRLVVGLQVIADNAEAAEQRQRRRRNLTAFAIVGVALAVIVVATFAVVDHYDQRRATRAALVALHENDASRARTRVGACRQTNVATDHSRGAFVAAYVTALSPTPAELDAYSKKIAQALPYRDCTSQAAVDDYYNHPPPDPATAP